MVTFRMLADCEFGMSYHALVATLTELDWAIHPMWSAGHESVRVDLLTL